jgi:archaellum component FlaC
MITQNKPATDLFGGAGSRSPDKPLEHKQLHELQKEQLIDRGDHKQSEALDRIRRTATVVEQTKEVAGDVEIEIQRQDDKIDEITSNVEDIKTDLKRSARLLG